MKAMSDRPMSSMGYGRPRSRVKVHSNRAHAGVRARFPFDLLRFPCAQKLQTPGADSSSATPAGRGPADRAVARSSVVGPPLALHGRLLSVAAAGGSGVRVMAVSGTP